MKSGHLLLVDDEELNRTLTAAQLEAEGYSVTVADSGTDALASFEKSPADLVLLDVIMPGLDGFETCRRLRAMPGGNSVPILFLTAHGDRATFEQALESGGDDFLAKPVDRIELLMRARSLLRVSRLQDELRRERDALLNVQGQKALLTDLIIHDLRNPLASILVNAEYLERHVSGEAAEAANDVIVSAESMNQMIENLTDVSRAEDGVLVPRLTTVNLRGVVEGIGQRMRRRFTQRNQSLELHVEAKLVVRVDESLLVRTLENLVDNAIRYSPRGSMVSIHGSSSGHALELTIADEGAGIPSGERPRIFEKYAQLEKAPLHRPSRGLGLVFCRLAVESMGGEIAVISKHPVGTAFRIFLPGVVIV